ncbi:DUF523 domain-containing protein [Lysinibacillus irui]|uniref:DUF523 domain-containing protein n=1 Tax=Lysinibacillus irui TaxID=2998077 RepID=A0ABU5NPK8_9BACI|nr:DUF523 domain-containing protein [Lysinibacillus irui]MEA0552020.1 DUF523 domain-containing protein [Lysinibacillus irui]MEA0977945.1 DUF523 domain-containing protein [Lysinibacillus irui]MEA1044099.1 DUF523 domain-containing protein [Lysinibacillus irui]
MILISACLAGINVRYNGTNSLNEKIQKLVLENKAVTVCPELMGGFTTPREPAEIVGGNGHDVLDGKARVVERSGRDVTELYLKGANATLQKAREIGATKVVLKEYSPSCGSAMIYNGEFNGTKLVGVGVTTALLQRHGIEVVSEEQFLTN